jgi:hypothetical protein
MLIADCQELSRQSHKVVALKTYATEVDRFRGRENQIQMLVEEISSLASALRGFRSRGIYNLTSTQTVDSFLNEVATISAKFSQDRGFLIGEEFKITALNTKSKALKNFLETELSQAWQTYKQERLPPVNMEFINLLEKISTFKPTVQKVRTIVGRLETIKFPKDENQFNQVEAFISELSNAWNSLQSSEVPESVLKFLRATSTGGASLDSLNSEVETWLKGKGIIHLFQIKLVG